MSYGSMTYHIGNRPAFAIIGWTLQGDDGRDRVRVAASRTLSTADLEVRRDYEDIWADGLGSPMRVRTQSRGTVITVEARDFVMIEAANWREIMEALYRQWAPL